MARPSSGPSYKAILADLAASLTGPIPLEDLIQQVLARKPSSAKNPRHAVRVELSHMPSQPFVFLDSKTLLPTRLAMQGARFRLPLGRRGAERGLIQMKWFASYLPSRFDLKKVQFVDAEGKVISAPRRSISEKVNDLLEEEYEQIVLYADLSAWLRPQNVTRRDDLLVTVLDWANGVLQLEVEPYQKRKPALIRARDRLLADLLYDILENARHEWVWIYEAIPTAYARLPEKAGCPPHHWRIIVEQDDRLRFDDYQIQYADAEPSFFERILQEQTGQPPPRRLQPVTQEQKRRVYRFKAALERNRRIWRKVEILGGQTLADLNVILVRAFQHDFDHLAGFWKIVPRRGAKTRYREVELGTVDPLGEGDGADVQIAAIGLQEGDRLKYVFDFGEWIEHILTLEAIYPAEEGVNYPREIARNKPRYLYCIRCQASGRERVASWYCITCFTDPTQGYCDECIEEHDDHYTREIVY